MVVAAGLGHRRAMDSMETTSILPQPPSMSSSAMASPRRPGLSATIGSGGAPIPGVPTRPGASVSDSDEEEDAIPAPRVAKFTTAAEVNRLAAASPVGGGGSNKRTERRRGSIVCVVNPDVAHRAQPPSLPIFPAPHSTRKC